MLYFKKNCSICFNSETKYKELEPLLSIDKNDLISSKSLKDIIYQKLSLLTICASCSYDYEEKIKNDSRYQACARQYIQSVQIPKFLFFCFELCQGDEPGEYQHFNLKKYKNKTKSFVTENLIFNIFIYIFYGTICIPSEVHYSSYCHLCLNNELNLENDNSHYYEGLINNGKIELVLGDFSGKFN